jgi:hypothetical protein
MSCTRRPRIAWLLAATLCAAGCLTGNRGSTSLDIPSADLIRLPGAKSARLEVSPVEAANPPGSQQVLIATVYDADGKPRRNRRVEWVIDGPGHVVAADESGLLTGRGHTSDARSAVTYTDYFSRKETRGTADPRDDFHVQAGQTWIIIGSAVAGETTVTAYAPDVPDASLGRVAVKLVWSDSQFGFPQHAIAPAGGDVELLTVLNRFPGKESPDGLRVRYRVLGGAPAELVAGSFSGGGLTEAEIAADANGKAAVSLVQPSPQAGTTRIAVEVVKPDPEGPGAGTIVGRKETTVEWAVAHLAFDAQAPRAAAVEREAVVNLVVSNAGKAESRPVTVKAALPDAAEFVRSDPPPTVQHGRELTWSLGPVAAGEKRAVALTVRPTRRGAFAIPAAAETADGFRAEFRASLDAERAGMKVAVEAPERSGVGDRVAVRVAVANPGAIPLENATAWVGFDPGLAHESGTNPAEVRVGTVPPGETRRVEVPLTARETGKSAVRVNVTADGGLAERAEAAVEVRNAALRLSLAGHETVTIGQDEDWTLTVVNAGDVAVPDVVARITLPAALRAKSASDGGALSADGAEWRLGELAPGEKKAVRLTAVAEQMAGRAAVSAAAHGGPELPVSSQAEVPVSVAGQPALALELANVPGMLPSGKRTAVRVTVRNRGSGPARKVEVSATTTEEFTVARGTGADRTPGRLDGRTVTFGVLDELPAGSAAVFVVELEGAKPGTGRVQAEVRAEHLPQPLREEQAARVVGGE